MENPLVNRRLVQAWLTWAMIWLTVFPLVGLILSVKFHHPGFLDSISWLTFGRMRPVHVNGVIFGSFSTGFVGLLYYAVPRLCGRRIYLESMGWILLVLWNLFLIVGSISLLMGFNLGLEAAEFEWPLNLLRFVVLGLIGVQVLGTIFRREEPRFYVSLWYISAAFIWTLMNLILGNAILPYSEEIKGVNSAAMHGLYIHYIVGLWLTPAGLSLIYYFLPLSADKPLFAHKLSLLGFWSLAFFYPFVGTHHYLYSPIPHWTQTVSIVTSMLLIIPVWAVTVNFFGTMIGQWGRVLGGKGADDYAAKFLILGAVYYLLGCFQGSVEALRRLQQLTHFNDFVIAHSHLTVFGSMVVWVIGGIYYVVPKISGRSLWSHRLASWHLWLTIIGFSLMAVGLIGQGYVQGTMLAWGVPFVDTVKEMKPWWLTRTVAGATMDIGLLFMLVNIYQTVRKGEPLSQTAEMAKPTANGSERSDAPQTWGWIESPSGVILAAGFSFFFLAVVLQGVIPWLTHGTRVSTVREEVTGQRIQVADYTPTERRGRQVYIREGCWYCHSQYIRPVTGEHFRWGPVSQVGEYAFDQPHLFSTRRIGPDLTRVGRKYGDDWHAAHHWDPREVVPDSIMPSFPWLFKPIDGEGPPELNADGKAIIAYIQKLGTAIGDWRETFAPTRISSSAGSSISPAAMRDLRVLGREVYERRCIGCHGRRGDGNGPAARFLDPKPRDFTKGIFKFRSTPGKNSLPTDGDLFATITHGLWGTAMPPWYEIPERERWAVIQYIKGFSDRWEKETVDTPIRIPPEPAVSAISLKDGKAVFQRCTICHGTEGKGDGPLAANLVDEWGHPERPANFTLPAGAPGGVKLGHDSVHLFKTVMTGIGGTPMPVFGSQLQADQIWDVVHYVQFLRVEAHIHHLKEGGLEKKDEPKAREMIWLSLSEAVQNGKIEASILRGFAPFEEAGRRSVQEKEG